MFVSRDATPSISVQSEVDILNDAAAAKLIVDTLDQRFGLKYAGKMP
jgi:hypothetical protein